MNKQQRSQYGKGGFRQGGGGKRYNDFDSNNNQGGAPFQTKPGFGNSKPQGSQPYGQKPQGSMRHSKYNDHYNEGSAMGNYDNRDFYEQDSGRKHYNPDGRPQTSYRRNNYAKENMSIGSNQMSSGYGAKRQSAAFNGDFQVQSGPSHGGPNHGGPSYGGYGRGGPSHGGSSYGGQGYGGQGHGFGKRPQMSNHSQSAAALVPANRGKGIQKIQVLSNQFSLKIGKNVAVYQYVLDIKPDELWEADRVHAIIRTKRSALEKALGAFVVSGKTIYTLCEIEESLEFNTTFRGQRCSIKIDRDYGQQVSLSNDFVNKENSVSQNLLNVIIKQAFRETNLKQLGRSPRFFDLQNPIDMSRAGLQIWSGFKASAIQSELGCTLAIDNIFKFMSTKTCLMRIHEIRQQARSDHQFEQICRLEFCGKSVIADWGNKRTYIVTEIDFEKNPVNYSFMYNDQKLKVADYFSMVYDKKVSDFNQPLFRIQISDQEYYLPPEFCLIDGVPDSVRKSAGMRDALARTRINPQDKIAKIQQMCELLFQQKAIKNWGLEISNDPIQLESSVLAAPEIFQQNQVVQCNEQILRRLPIQKAVDLLNGEWIMMYQNGSRFSNYQAADKVYNTFIDACGQLKIKVEEPEFIELESEGDRAEIESKLLDYMMASKNSVFRHPKIIVFVLGQESQYSMIKEVFQEYKVPSQVVTVRNAKSFNASKASNILRQINSKCGGDLFNLKFPQVLDKMRTMLIGIDVCHSGPQSIVGLACSINKEMSQYYSTYLVQKKGQEIIEQQMKDALKSAIEAFSERHKGELPTNYVIYRDGVGDAQRSQVISREVTQFREAFAELYNKAEVSPKVTLVVVNKRITQRFFIRDHRGCLANPPSGCIIDRGLVEKSGSDEVADQGFDFYITPSGANQGCVLPTHMHVPLNESSMKKIEIQQLSYALCHYYFNWAGSIKVPAPCQYAHKIADFYVSSGLARKKQKQPARKSNVPEQQLTTIKQKCEKVVPLAKKLHFL